MYVCVCVRGCEFGWGNTYQHEKAGNSTPEVPAMLLVMSCNEN